MPGIVRDVSATLVATTHSLDPSGGGLKTWDREREKTRIRLDFWRDGGVDTKPDSLYQRAVGQVGGRR
jgi:hypothetical protein